MKRTSAITVSVLIGCLALSALDLRGADSGASTSTPQPAKSGIWKGAVGEGFLRSVQHVGVVAGAGAGMEIFGSSQTHDLALGGISYGRMWGDVRGEGHWWRGNWEWRVEVFGGSQFYPTGDYLVGVTPHLRYNFATGTRLVPFFDLGAGVTGTDIRNGDLGGYFQFNLQAGAGVNYFFRDNAALSLEARYFHLSNARLSTPNLGLNSILFLAGLNWYF